MSVNAIVSAVTEKIIERSKPTRSRYLARIAAAASSQPKRVGRK